MTYEPTNWKDGDLVTSAKLNKIEQGIAAGGGVLIVHDEDGTLDKTWQEIYDADACIINVSTDSSKEFAFVVAAEYAPKLQAYMIMIQDEKTYTASSPDDYPALGTSGGLPSGSDIPIL